MGDDTAIRKKGFGYWFREGLRFLTNVDIITGIVFFTLMLAQLPYYTGVAKIIAKVMSISTDKLTEMLTTEGIGSLISTEYSTLIMSLMISTASVIFTLSTIYAVFYLHKLRYPDRDALIFSGMLLSILILFLRSLIFTGMYYLCCVSFYVLVLFLRPITIFSTCFRADRRSNVFSSMWGSIAVMKGQFLRSVLYTGLCWAIITFTGTLVGSLISSFIPEYTSVVLSISMAFTNTVYILTYTRMFTAMYRENTPLPADDDEDGSEIFEEETDIDA